MAVLTITVLGQLRRDGGAGEPLGSRIGEAECGCDRHPIAIPPSTGSTVPVM